MTRTAPELAEAALAEARELNPQSYALVERYVSLIDWKALEPGERTGRQVARVRALRRGLEHARLDGETSRDLLSRLSDAPLASPYQRELLRSAVNRLRRAMSESAELPNVADLRSRRKVEEVLAGLPAPSRRHLAGWLEERARVLAPHQLATEARWLASLERMAAADPHPDGGLIELWLVSLVRTVVNCPHRFDAHHGTDGCRHCDATPATHGVRVSPTPKKQVQLRRLAGRYLIFRERSG